MFNLFKKEDALESIQSKLLPVQMSSDIEIQVDGLLVKAHITQTFTNTSDEPIEAIHAIPVPSDATLVDFKVHKNTQTWQGQVMERTQADQAFEESIEKGDSAFQLKRSKEDLFTLVLGNLRSKETLSIELELAFTMQWIAGEGQIYLPLVMGERYGHSNLLPEEDPESSFLAEYPLNLKLTLEGTVTNAQVESPSHPLIEGSQPNQFILSGKGLLDRDLKINFSNLTDMTSQFRLNKVGEDYLGLVNVMTQVGAIQYAAPRDVLFVLDCSGSMTGQSMTQLKKVMRHLLNQMRPQDRFNLYPYGSTVESVFKEIQPVTETSILKAKRYVRRTLDANLGGTRTERALLTALMSYQKSQATDIVLVTDGQSWMNEEDNQFKLLKAYTNQENVRIFPVGVGHATTQDTVKKFAEMSNGSYVLTNPNEDISFIMQAHFKRLFQSPLSVQLKTDSLWHQIPTVYQGDAIQIPVCFSKLPGLVELEITHNDTTETYQLKPNEQENIALQKWVANQRYPSLKDSEQVAFAVKHQLLTDQTDYLILLERQESEKSDALPSLVKMPQMNVHETGTDDNARLKFLSNATGGPEPMFSRRSMDEHPSSPIEPSQNAEQKQIKALSKYLNQVNSGKKAFSIERLDKLGLSEDSLYAIRMLSLLSDETETIQLLITLCKIHTEWQAIEAALNLHLEKLD